jgi:hypothetical protein
MMEMASCFSILLVALPAPFRQQADGRLDFLSLHPKDSGVLLHLMTRLCSMIAWNGLIPRWGGYRLGRHGQKIYFPF